MKKPLLALGTLALALSATVSAETLRFATDASYPPFSKQGADGKMTGFDPDIAQALCAVMKAKCEIVPQDFDGIIPALQAKKFDAVIASMNITEERKKAVDFSDKYYNMASRLVAKQGTQVNAAWFKGKKIGVLRSSIQEKYARDTFAKQGAQLVSYGKAPESFMDLKAGRVDAAFVDAAVGDVDFVKTPNGKGFALVGPDYNEAKYFGVGSGIAVRKGDKALLTRINAALKQIRADGSYDKIQKKYFSFDIYGK
ncbi:ABC transporter substrate-binding protein [Vogesella sp. EB]|jgi:arginine/ornithine transport system substrate-binding protein|uniref:Arginine/ornithine transport system substrate-binding protein n=1 Tax=Vogesella indigofera TaxID=45465 RepID=A0A495B2C2_VOGIN|nr:MULTISPECIES: ABC transporter substrate-binding protein [Vogesella]KMJ54071.1 ABC transporter substrate-binding protein [Vogesella sp. EB]MCQ4144905.1 ABC transporter substrate-binding protein [Vogesella sp. AC12]RKQ54763.1 arginine/ornithine transport system substrate-binding protein [Vogesella indigofera]